MFQSGSSWPKPPAPPHFHEVDVEAQRLASEALHRASYQTEASDSFDAATKQPQVAPQHPEVERPEGSGDEGQLHRSHTFTIKSDG